MDLRVFLPFAIEEIDWQPINKPNTIREQNGRLTTVKDVEKWGINTKSLNFFNSFDNKVIVLFAPIVLSATDLFSYIYGGQKNLSSRITVKTSTIIQPLISLTNIIVLFNINYILIIIIIIVCKQ